MGRGARLESKRPSTKPLDEQNRDLMLSRGDYRCLRVSRPYDDEMIAEESAQKVGFKIF